MRRGAECFGLDSYRGSYRRSWYRLSLPCLWCCVLAVTFQACSNPVGPDRTQTLITRIASELHTVQDVRKLMSHYRSRPDSTLGLPTVESVFYDFAGDCAGAAVVGEWALEQIGRPASVYLLNSPEWGHCIAVTDDGGVMVSNRDVIELADPANWKTEVMAKFKKSVYRNQEGGIIRWKTQDFQNSKRL